MSVEVFMERYFEKDSRPSKQTVWRWIRNGLLPAKRNGRRYYIKPSDALKFLELQLQ